VTSPPSDGTDRTEQDIPPGIQELLQQGSRVAKRSQVSSAGIAGVLLVLIFYFGQAQTERLDRVVDGVNHLRIEVTQLAGRVDSVEQIRGEISRLHSDLERHSALPAHSGAIQNIGVLQTRLLAIEQRLNKLDDRLERLPPR